MCKKSFSPHDSQKEGRVCCNPCLRRRLSQDCHELEDRRAYIMSPDQPGLHDTLKQQQHNQTKSQRIRAILILHVTDKDTYVYR